MFEDLLLFFRYCETSYLSIRHRDIFKSCTSLRVVESTTGYTFTSCVGISEIFYFPYIDTR